MSDLSAWLDGVIAANARPIDELARAIVATHERDGLVYSAGSGHSMSMVMETFFRAGGLARVRPLQRPVLQPLNGALAATAAEREEGIGRDVAIAAGIAGTDTVVIFSNSGRNPYPVEIAQEAQRRGATVAALTSVAASLSSASRAGARLCEVADVVLDTHTRPGDSSEPPHAPVTSPLSTIACAALWSRVLARVVELQPDVPLWRSANKDGNDAHNDELVALLRRRIPEL